MTHRQLHHQSPPLHGDSSQKLDTWSTLHNLQAAQQVGGCPLRCSAGLNLFQAAELVPASSRQLICSHSLLGCLRVTLQSLLWQGRA